MTAREFALAGAVGAVVVCFISYVVEVQAILRRPAVQPERTSWLIWALEYAACFAAQFKEGGVRGSLWLVGEEFAGVLLIYALSLRYGVGGSLVRRARNHRRAGVRPTASGILLIGVCVALVAWLLTRSAAVAVLLLAAVETAGAIPTVVKIYRLPSSEPLMTWALVGVAGILAIPAVGARAPAVLYAYPATLIATGFAVVAASWLPARRSPAAAGVQPAAVAVTDAPPPPAAAPDPPPPAAAPDTLAAAAPDPPPPDLPPPDPAPPHPAPPHPAPAQARAPTRLGSVRGRPKQLAACRPRSRTTAQRAGKEHRARPRARRGHLPRRQSPRPLRGHQAEADVRRTDPRARAIPTQRHCLPVRVGSASALWLSFQIGRLELLGEQIEHGGKVSKIVILQTAPLAAAEMGTHGKFLMVGQPAKDVGAQKHPHVTGSGTSRSHISGRSVSQDFISSAAGRALHRSPL